MDYPPCIIDLTSETVDGNNDAEDEPRPQTQQSKGPEEEEDDDEGGTNGFVGKCQRMGCISLVSSGRATPQLTKYRP